MRQLADTFLALLAVILFAGGCLGSDHGAGQPALSLSVSSAEVDASPSGSGALSYSFVLTSNQSWGAVLSDMDGGEVSWMGSEDVEGLNLDGVAKDFPVTLTFEDNPDFVTRSARMTFRSADCETSLIVTQRAKQPWVEIDHEQTATSLSYRGGTARIWLRANCDWTASLSDGLNDASLSKTSGTAEDEYIDLTFGPKTALDAVLEASVSLSLNDYPEKTDEITLTQAGGAYLKIWFTSLSSRYNTEWDPAMPSKTTASDYVLGTYTHIPTGLSLSFGNSEGKGLTFITYSSETYLNFDRTGSTIGWIRINCPADRKIDALEVHAINSAQKKFSVYASVSDTGAGSTLMGALTPSDAGTPVEWGSEALPWTIAPDRGQSVVLHVSKNKNTMVDYIAVSIQ